MAILFRQIRGKDPIPSSWTGDLHWYVEYHDDEYDVPFPLGVAYVTDLRGSKVEGVPDGVIDFILVADKHRRTGVATKLVDAIYERWGSDVYMTEAISDDGAAFLASRRETRSPARSEE